MTRPENRTTALCDHYVLGGSPLTEVPFVSSQQLTECRKCHSAFKYVFKISLCPHAYLMHTHVTSKTTVVPTQIGLFGRIKTQTNLRSIHHPQHSSIAQK
jgi:hypothetical protein